SQQIARELEDGGRQLAKLDKQITARTRALPLFRAIGESEDLAPERRSQREHAVHTLLRRLYHESATRGAAGDEWDGDRGRWIGLGCDSGPRRERHADAQGTLRGGVARARARARRVCGEGRTERARGGPAGRARGDRAGRRGPVAAADGSDARLARPRPA